MELFLLHRFFPITWIFLLKFHYNAVPSHEIALSNRLLLLHSPDQLHTLPQRWFRFLCRISRISSSFCCCSFALHQNCLSDGTTDDLTSPLRTCIHLLAKHATCCFSVGTTMVSCLSSTSSSGNVYFHYLRRYWIADMAPASRSKEDWLSAYCKISLLNERGNPRPLSLS